MNRWQEQLDNHPIWQTIEQIKGHLNVEFENTDENWFMEKRRLLGVIDQFASVFKELNAELVPFRYFNDLNSHLTNNVLSQTKEFSKSGNINHLRTANEQINDLLTNFGIIKSLCGHPEKSGVVSDLNKQVDSFSASLLNRQKTLEEGLDALGNELKGREKQIQEALSSRQEELDTMIEDGESKHKRILELYEIVAEDSATAGYAKQADDERKQANLWRWLSFSFIIVTTTWLLAVVGYIHFLKEGLISWSAYPNIISVTGVLLFGAGYTAQQSTRHRENERKSRSLALRVAAFEPFVSPLSDDLKNGLRRDIADKIFGGIERKDSDG